MKRNLILLACACLALTNARAATILDVGLGSSLVVGEVIPQVLSGGQEARDLSMVNTVVNMYNGTTPVAAPYMISGNVFPKPLPSATTTGDVITPATGFTFTPDLQEVIITIGTSSKYLIAAYDGGNSGAVVWDISGLAAGTTIEIPAFAQPNAGGTDLVDGKYGITTWSLFNPGTTTVPDGGTTVLLLGAAVSALGVVRRKLS